MVSQLILQSHLFSLTDERIAGVQKIPPNIQGMLHTMYRIIKISWASWSSVDVI